MAGWPGGHVKSFILLMLAMIASGEDQKEAFYEAARNGDLSAVKELIEKGVDIDVKSRYGLTALAFALNHEQNEVALFLLEKGASPNIKDTFYNMSIMGSAPDASDEVGAAMIKAGAEKPESFLSQFANKDRFKSVKAILATGKVKPWHLKDALDGLKEEQVQMKEVLLASGIKPAIREGLPLSDEEMNVYVGYYAGEAANFTFESDGKDLYVVWPNGKVRFIHIGNHTFEHHKRENTNVVFTVADGRATDVSWNQNGRSFPGKRAGKPAAMPKPAAKPEATAKAEKPEPVVVKTESRKPAIHWGSFRGGIHAGVADGQALPTSWDLEKGENVAWKTAIPGLTTASPLIWGDRTYTLTAVSSAGNNDMRPGVYGDVDSVEDVSKHSFRVYCLSMKDGKILWEKEVANREPLVKRHLKSTQSNSTSATDGKHLVSIFGSIGLLVCHDMDGKELWRKDLGLMDSGWFYDKSYQWGYSASPVIYKNTTIVQVDIQGQSYIAAYSLKDGSEIWKTNREEIPTWGTPAVYQKDGKGQVITNGTKVRGYDADTGEELWSLGPNSEITVATPVIYKDHFYVTGGYPPARPVYVIKPEFRGTVEMPDGEEEHEGLLWSKSNGGTYIPSPIAYRNNFYTVNNDGRLSCYRAESGERVFRARVGGRMSFVASPIASDGRLFFFAETGEVIVVAAGDNYAEIGRNDMGEVVSATPAASNGVIVVRTAGHMVGLGSYGG